LPAHGCASVTNPHPAPYYGINCFCDPKLIDTAQ
jgi:hypothetical protein